MELCRRNSARKADDAPGQHVYYRVTLEGEDGVRSEPVTGVFTTAPAAITDIKFVWSGDGPGGESTLTPAL